MSIMDIVAQDGKNHEIVCLPLNMINGWLFGIDANRVKPEIKENVLAYQRECYAVLYDYWHGNGAYGALKPADEIRYLNQRLQLLRELNKVRDPLTREKVFEQFKHVSDKLGFDTPPLAAFRTPHSNDALDEGTRVTIEQFFHAIEEMERLDIALDHHRDPTIFAVNLNEVLRLADDNGVPMPSRPELLRALPQSIEPRFVGANVTVCSVFAKNKQGKPKTVRCYLFRRK